MGQDAAGDFNHVVRQGNDRSLSILADANAFPSTAADSDLEEAASTLLAKAKRSLGPIAFQRHQLRWYACTKTECAPGPGTPRDYSYWWGPPMLSRTNQAWQSVRAKQRTKAEHAILEWVRGRAGGAGREG